MKKPSFTTIPNQIFDAHETIMKRSDHQRRPQEVTTSRQEQQRSAKPDTLPAEIWLLQGGGRSSNVAVNQHIKKIESRKNNAQLTTKDQNQRGRGRSPNPIKSSPSKYVTSTTVMPNTKKTTSSPMTSPVAVTPQKIVGTTPSPMSQTHVRSRSHGREAAVKENTPPSPTIKPLQTPCPIPSVYISQIRTVFGGLRSTSPINLYTDVLGLSSLSNTSPSKSSSYTDAQIRVAFFRQGRLILQQKDDVIVDSSPSSSPNSTVLLEQHHYDLHKQSQNKKFTAKDRFQAVNKAYEILTNPVYKTYYECYGLPPMKPDAPGTTTIKLTKPVDEVTRNVINNTKQQQPNSFMHSLPGRCNEDDRNDFNNSSVQRNIVSIDDSTSVGRVAGIEKVIGDEDDVESVASLGSILRNRKYRSKSWGPSTQRHLSSTKPRVVWKEVVQELIYQPDPPSNQSIDVNYQYEHEDIDQKIYFTMPPDEQNGDIDNSTRIRIVEDVYHHDFLDDFEASVDGIGETIGNFVKYLSVHDVKNHSIEIANDDDSNQDAISLIMEQLKRQQHDVSHLDVKSTTKNSNEIAEICNDLNVTDPIPPKQSGGGAYAKRISDHRRNQSLSDINSRLTTMAPLKEGSTDQKPRNKIKKSNRKKKREVDRVPSNMNNLFPNMNLTNIDVFDPFSNSIDTSLDFVPVEPTLDSSNSCVFNPNCGVELDPYALPEASSILASVDGGNTVSDNVSQNLCSERSLSFDDALNLTTDATTKGYLRLDRRANSMSAIIDIANPTLNVSGVSYKSEMSDDPAGRHFHGFLSSLTTSAKETIKEIASFDEENNDEKFVQLLTTNKSINDNLNTASSAAMSSSKTEEVDVMTKVASYMQSFMNDMNVLGSQITAQIQETMTLPAENEVSGFMEKIGAELLLTKSKDQAENDLHKSFTY